MRSNLKMMINKKRLIEPRYLFGFMSLIFMLLVELPAFGLKLPSALKESITKTLPVARVRIDGGIETNTGALYLPLIPSANKQQREVSLKAAYPNKGTADFLLFSNDWCFLRVLSHSKQKTVMQLADLPANLQKALLATKFSSDLIVPERFVLPASMKTIGSAVGIPVEDMNDRHTMETKSVNVKTTVLDSATKPGAEKVNHGETVASAAIASVTKPNKSIDVVKNGEGWVLVTSPATGKISLLSYPELIKIIEFPIEGTPSGVTFANGVIYIADQTKCRILKLDPYHKVFLGQINLPAHSNPKDVIALPGGKLIYVSESTLNDVAVFETDTDKLLVRTKVHSYPGRMAVTPNGNCLIVLSVPDGKASLVSTRNQRFLGVVPVGALPHGIAVTANNRIAYVTNRLSNTISVIDLLQQMVLSTLKAGNAPTGIAIDYEHNHLYVANAKDNAISICDFTGAKKADDIKLPMDLDFPGSLTMLPDNKHILVSSESTDALGLLDINTRTFEKITTIGHSSDQCLWIPLHE